RRVGDELRTRLARSLGTFAVPNQLTQSMDTTHTERINRILLLWLDLHRALRHAELARPHSTKPSPPPWECQEESVAQLWQQLTDPKNQRALEEWLCQSAEGQPAAWARQALQACRDRQAN